MSNFVGFVLAALGASTSPPKIDSHVAPNGLTVLVVENHSVPVVTIEIASKNGSMTEPPEYNGLSHLYEHMFFKANAKVPSQELWLEKTRELGIRWNGTTNTERVNYFFTTTADHLADTMQFMHDAIVSPKFDPKELDRERVVVTGELDRNESTPGYHLYIAVQRAVFWKYPSRKDPLGRRKTVLEATQAKMKTIQKRYYIPNNSVLTITGDVKAAEIFAQVDKLYADWKRGPDPFKAFPLVKHPPIKKTQVIVVEQPVQTVSGELVWHGPSTVGDSVPDTYVADAYFTALNEPSSPFQKALVDSGACVGAGIGWYTQQNTGPITINFEALPNKADDCVRAVAAELGKLREATYVTAEDLGRAARSIEVSLVRDRERPSELAHTLTFWWTTASLEYYLGYIDHLYKVTPADAVKLVDRWMTNKPYVAGVMLSPELAKQGMTVAHFEQLLGVGAKKAGAK
ncbi:MAG TPA: pitrilysin family protein [Kofleriaceae bacterium]